MRDNKCYANLSSTQWKTRLAIVKVSESKPAVIKQISLSKTKATSKVTIVVTYFENATYIHICNIVCVVRRVKNFRMRMASWRMRACPCLCLHVIASLVFGKPHCKGRILSVHPAYDLRICMYICTHAQSVYFARNASQNSDAK